MILHAIRQSDRLVFLDTDETTIRYSVNNDLIEIDTNDIMYFATALWHLYKFFSNLDIEITGFYVEADTTFDFKIDCKTGNLTSNNVLLKNAIERVDTMTILLDFDSMPLF